MPNLLKFFLKNNYKMKTKAWAVVLMFTTTAITSFAQIFYKLGSEKLNFDLVSQLSNYHLIIGMILYVIGAFMVIIAFRGGDVSVLYPIIATSYIWVSFLSIWFLGEAMNFYKWVGIFIIFSGIVLIGYGSKSNEKHTTKVVM